MTQAEALQEARKRWGDKARTNFVYEHGQTYYQIGVPGTQHFPGIYYEGDSWEAAFADADKRGAVALRG